MHKSVVSLNENAREDLCVSIRGKLLTFNPMMILYCGGERGRMDVLSVNHCVTSYRYVQCLWSEDDLFLHGARQNETDMCTAKTKSKASLDEAVVLQRTVQEIADCEKCGQFHRALQ